MSQFGFYFDPNKCIGCHACTQACQVQNDLDTDEGILWRRVEHVGEGEFPDYDEVSVSIGCHHCSEPTCRDVCPTHALEKRDTDGIVTINQSRCIGCNYCSYACPYGAIQFGEDGIAQKCNGCLGSGPGNGHDSPSRDESETARETPACTDNCVTGALKAGPINELVREASEDAAKEFQLDDVGPALILEPENTVEVNDGDE
ncbi:4Fe-4S dicluster domain-containing protein [Salinarchaeum sp. IM2453]|uniref:4Fe-4S dicluster domain-containing protein n=1 Tax=Salinarchaeum sp. IM2453 TaxID=2862870 RepID=UPI0021048DEC|nr:4Fe-4S dicluster domain-containing protein [Salinarchaeum sp. IM2453]